MKNYLGKFGSTTRYWILLTIVAIGLLAFSGYTYWRNVYSTPDAVFARMLSNALTTSGFVRASTQSAEGQSLELVSLQTTAPYHQVRTLNILEQGDQTSITTENIATIDKNYVRYIDIKTAQARQDGSPFDFSQVLGTWGIVDATENDNSVATIYTGNVVVPFANLSAENQHKLYEQIVNDGVYEINYQTIRTEQVDGRKTYVYEVTVNPVPYIKMIKTLSSMLGQNQLESLDPEQYASVEPLQFDMYVDVLSSQLTRVVYDDQAGTTEYYGSYGLRDVELLPAQAIPLTELQSRLQQLQ